MSNLEIFSLLKKSRRYWINYHIFLLLDHILCSVITFTYSRGHFKWSPYHMHKLKFLQLWDNRQVCFSPCWFFLLLQFVTNFKYQLTWCWWESYELKRCRLPVSTHIVLMRIRPHSKSALISRVQKITSSRRFDHSCHHFLNLTMINCFDKSSITSEC